MNKSIKLINLLKMTEGYKEGDKADCDVSCEHCGGEWNKGETIKCPNMKESTNAIMECSIKKGKLKKNKSKDKE
jgi:hypothetical protein